MADVTRRLDQLLRTSVTGIDTRALGIAIFVVGGLLVFQNSDALDAPKVAYMLATLVVVATASRRLIRERTLLLGQPILVAWLSVSVAFGSLVAISLPVAIASGTPVTSWLRDAAPYAMFAFAPLLAVDGRSLPRQFFLALLIAGGVLAAASFSIEWIGRRGILELPIQRLVLPTGILASTLLAYAAARAALARRYPRWIILGGIILGLFFVTGTRSTLLLFVIPCMVALLSRRGPRRALGIAGGMLSVGLSILLLFSAALVGLPGLPTANPIATPPGASVPAPSSTPIANPIKTRIDSIGSVIQDPAGDQSLAERIAQTLAAWQVIAERPIYGAGPGHMIAWDSAVRGPQTGFTLDTPLVFPAKFGLVGIVVLAWLIAVYVATLRTYYRRGAKVAFLTLAGFGTVFVLAALLNSPFEDKGLSYATLLVLGASFADDPEPATIRTDARNDEPRRAGRVMR